MDSYKDLTGNVMEYEACKTLYKAANGAVDDNTKALYNLAIQYKESWANFVEDMLDNSGRNAFNDDEFGGKIIDAKGRISPLKETDLLIDMSLTPTSRDSFGNMTVYIGRGDGDNNNELYTVMIPATYIVQDTFTGFCYGIPSPLKAYCMNFLFNDFSYSN